ncbi:hypothetical protein H4R18_001962 [Coemansia javaensis]|uniref:BED-type domain-containing protein n=1 Tax=Coemansia javaensis TaxID=2761396 RepID=A0A9W8HE96_9FUNG|nr:hypothetical protein H4R18_001962 [Coemansia javaensis]
MSNPPSDIDVDVDLSSDLGSEGPMDEAEASQLLGSSKAYGFGSAPHPANQRRMDFSPTPSPPPPDAPGQPAPEPPFYQQQQQQQQLPAHNGAPLPAAHGPPTYDDDDAAAAAVAAAAAATDATATVAAAESAGAAAYPGGLGPANGLDDNMSDAGSAKEDSIESGSVRNPSSPPPSTALGAAASTPAARSRTSIWTHFTRDPDYATNRRGRCVYCQNYYSCSSGSTGNMWRHIKRSHPEKAAHAAPLGTHHAATPQQPQPPQPLSSQQQQQQTPQQQPPPPQPPLLQPAKPDDAAPAYDSRPRKRQASLSSPASERFGTPITAVRPGLQALAQTQGPGPARAPPGSATRTLEDAIFSELGEPGLAAAGDADVTSADSLVHALKLLLSMSGRTHALDRLAAQQPAGAQPGQAHQSSASLLGGLLDSLSASRNASAAAAAEAGHALGDVPRLPRLGQSAGRGHSGGGAGSGGAGASASGSLPTILEERRSGAAPGDGSAAALYHHHHHDARRGGHPDPESISHFVSAIADAIRAGTGAGARAQRSLDAIVDFMIRDLVPVDRMLSPGMQQLVAAMSHGAPLPTAAELVDEICRRKDAQAQQLRRQLDAVRGKVSVSIGARRVSGTTHCLAVHAHWTDDDVVRHDALLSSHFVDGAPSSGDVMSAFESTLTQFNLFGRLGAVTTNYTRESVEFLNQVETICHARGASFDLDRNQSTCIASALRDAQTKLLAMLHDADRPGAAAQSGPSVEQQQQQQPMQQQQQQQPQQQQPTPLAKLCSALRSLLAPSQPASQQLVALCRSRGISLATLEYDEAAPWQSVAQVLDGALSIYADLPPILEAGALPALSPEEWLWLSQARALMRVVDVAIDALTRLPSEFPSIVDLVPIYDTLGDNLHGLLQTPSLCDGIRRSGEALREYLAQCHPFQASPIYRLAPLFDPRLKAAYYADRGHDDAWTARVMREARSLLSEYVQPRPAAADDGADGTNGTTGTSSSVPPVFAQAQAQAAAGSQGGDITAAIDAFIWLGRPAAGSQLAADGKARIFKRAFATGRSELDDYIGAPLAAPSASAVAWWRVHRAAFPDLARLASEYLSIPASCSEVSSIFKRAGAPDYAPVAGLDRRLADAYICLHHWQRTAPRSA